MRSVLQAMASVAMLRGLRGQLIWQVGRCVQMLTAQAVKGQAAPGWAAKKVHIAGLLQTPDSPAERLARHPGRLAVLALGAST